jgi:hypothetical protein
VTRKDKMTCSVCLNANNKPTFGLTCGHKFHKKCIYAWFEFDSSCPYCRNVDQKFIEEKTLCFAKAMCETMAQCLSTPPPVDTDIKYTKYTLYYKSSITKAIKNRDLQYLWDRFSKLYKHSCSCNYSYVRLYEVTVSKIAEGNAKNKWSVIIY